MAKKPYANDVLHAVPLSEAMVGLKLTEDQIVAAAFSNPKVTVLRLNVNAALANAWGLVNKT